MGRGIVFFDIDGTLCRYAGKVDPGLKECFRKFHEKGNAAFLCTGRSPVDIQPDILELGFDGMIALMGAYIEVGGKVIQNKCIPQSLLKETVDVLLANRIQAFLLGREIYARTEYAKDYDWNLPVFHGMEDLYVNGHEPEIASIDLDFGRIEDIEICLPVMEKHSEFIQYSDITGQTRLHGVNKSRGIMTVLGFPEYRGMTSYAIGDSQNDIEMLRFVDVGIAMGDAPQEVSDCAKWQTSVVEADGVGRALRHFGLA